MPSIYNPSTDCSTAGSMVKVVPIRRLGGIPYAYPTLPSLTHGTEPRAFETSIFLEQSKMFGFRTGISGSHQHSHGAVSGNLQRIFDIYAYNSMDILIYYTMNEIQWEMRILFDTVVALLNLYQLPLPKRHVVNQE